MGVIGRSSEHVDLVLPEGMMPLADVRAQVRRLLLGMHENVVVDVMVVATELVSNAYHHAAPPRRVRVMSLPEREVVRVEVEDGTPGRFPQLGRMGFLGRRQRGLLLVNGLAQVWGHNRFPEFKTVWADITTVR
ncbi:ATP-binding protein [Lentzea sp. NPDC042327]|uniref:ATP-binding protein n=1 Tax=Lentzea sp. NPDC042327 TaxID=3154801 RepID=UPI00340504F0